MERENKMSIFETASRTKLRFDYRGKISAEDLWDLPLTTLDEIYGVLRSSQKMSTEDSLLRKETKDGRILALKIDLVKHVVATKLQEDEAKKARATAKIQKEKIASIIAKKQDEGLESMSIEELQKQMKDLDS